MIRIVVDSAADYQTAELLDNNVEMVPLTVSIGSELYKDEYELSRQQLYEKLLEGKDRVTTSQPSPQDFVDHFEEAKEAGDDVICITLSSALSGTYQSACLAKDIVDYDNIYIIDSLSATVAVMIMVEKAQKMMAEGKTAPEIVEVLEELKGRIKIIAAIDTLKYLWLGGRVSKTTAVVADAANIKPGIEITRSGEVGVGSKYLGIGRAVKDLTKKTVAANIDPEHHIYLIYSHVRENVDKLQKSLEHHGIQVDGVHELGATLGVHVGPGAFGVIYIEK